MTARHAIYIYLTIGTVLGALSGLLSSTHPDAGALIGLMWLILGPVTGYVWFRLDSEERRFQGSPGWSRGVILFAPVALPIYLYKSRAKGRRLKAISMLVGIFFLSVVLPIIVSAAVAPGRLGGDRSTSRRSFDRLTYPQAI